MLQLLLLTTVALGAWGCWGYWNRLQQLPPELRGKALWRGALAAVAVVLLVLAATGRASWVVAAVATTFAFAHRLLALALRVLPVLHLAGRASGARIGPTLKTAWLQVKINLADGTLDGDIVQGEFAGQPLSALSRDQLQRLFTQLQTLDRPSALLLGAYLTRRFGAAGAAHGGATRDEAGANDGQERFARQATGALTNAEAAQILGVAVDATPAEIVHAHRRLIQKLHPDRGGSDYLAAKVNAAKDHLLKARA